MSESNDSDSIPSNARAATMDKLLSRRTMDNEWLRNMIKERSERKAEAAPSIDEEDDSDGKATISSLLPPADRMVYVASAGNSNVSVIDGGTNTVIATVTVGDLPIGVAVNENTNFIYVVNFGQDTVSVIDGSLNMVVATITVGSEPQEIGVNSVTNRIYVANCFILPLTASVTLNGNNVYYLAVYNQINGSTIGGRSTGSGTVGNAFPINFRVQNIAGFSVGQVVNTSDVSLLLSPYVAGLA